MFLLPWVLHEEVPPWERVYDGGYIKAIEDDLFQQGVSQISVGIFPRNDASKKVAAKCGFVLDGLYKDFLEFDDEHTEDVEFYHVDNPYQLAS